MILREVAYNLSSGQGTRRSREEAHLALWGEPTIQSRASLIALVPTHATPVSKSFSIFDQAALPMLTQLGASFRNAPPRSEQLPSSAFRKSPFAATSPQRNPFSGASKGVMTATAPFPRGDRYTKQTFNITDASASPAGPQVAPIRSRAI